MVMLMLRPMMSQQVLGTEALFIPDDHLPLCLIGNVQSVQGRVLSSSAAPTLTHVELTIHMNNKEANALVTSLMLDCLESPILEGVTGPIVLLE